MSKQRSFRLSVFCRFLALALLLAAAPASWAGKPEPRPELPRVGAAQRLRVVPEPGRFVKEGSGAVWREVVKVPGAAFLKPRFANFNLAPGDLLTVRSQSGRVVEELRGLGPRDAGSFWGLSVWGEELHLELRAAARYGRPPFEIEAVIVGDPQMLAAVLGDGRSVCAPEDYDDAICYQGDAAKWANMRASAGVMTTGGGIALWCSGVNVSPLNYLLTNYHCIPEAGSCASSEFVFRYYREGCNNGAPTTGDWVSYRCGSVVASSPVGGCDPTLTTLDFSLNTVLGDPAGIFGYAQPDATELTSGERVYIVQHPGGRPQQVSHGEGADLVVDLNAGAGTRTLRYYGSLDTDGGSSGSPIFRDSDDKMVGLHHCGGCEEPGVGNRGMLMTDIRPAIAPYLCTAAASLVVDSPPAPLEVAGNGDAFLDPGETWSLRPSLRNRSCASAALGVTATVAVDALSVPLTLLDTAVSFGDIAAGHSGLAQQAIRFVVPPGTSCAGEAILRLAAITSGGGLAHPDGESWRRELGSVPVTSLLFENFAGGIPGSWTVVHNGGGSGPAATWTTGNPGGRTLLLPPFAIADSDALGLFSMNEELISPAIAAGGFSHLSLELEHVFQVFATGPAQVADIDVRSSATGGNWVNLWRRNTNGSGHLSLDLLPYAAAGLQIRFHYYDAEDDWYWAIDDVTVRGDHGRTCAPQPIFRDGFESGNTSAWWLTLP